MICFRVLEKEKKKKTRSFFVEYADKDTEKYCLSYQDETLAAGYIVGLGGQQQEHNDPKLENTEFAAEIPELPSSFDPDFSIDIKGMYMNSCEE